MIVVSTDQHRANKGDPAGGTQAGAVNQDSASPTAAVHAEPKAHEANKTAHSEKPKSYENVIARWTVVLGFSTVVLAIATILSAYFLYVTDHTLKDTLTETRKAADAATKAARVAEDSNKTAADAAKRQLRAYLAITKFDLQCTNCPNKNHPFTPPGRALAEVRVLAVVKNSGVTPAYQVQACISSRLVDRDTFLPDDFSFDCEEACRTCPATNIGPGIDATIALPMKTGEIMLSGAGFKRLFYYGTISFTDTFKGKRKLPFCWFHQGDTDVIKCPYHNTPDDD